MSSDVHSFIAPDRRDRVHSREPRQAAGIRAASVIDAGTCFRAATQNHAPESGERPAPCGTRARGAASANRFLPSDPVEAEVHPGPVALPLWNDLNNVVGAPG